MAFYLRTVLIVADEREGHKRALVRVVFGGKLQSVKKSFTAMQKYGDSQQQVIAQAVLRLLAKYKESSEKADDSDLRWEVRDENGEFLLGAKVVDEIQFLKNDGYLEITESQHFDGKPRFEFQITKDGLLWLKLLERGGLTKKLLREQILSCLVEREKEMSWGELVKALKECGEIFALVSRDQVLNAVRYLVKKGLAKWDPLRGDNKIMQFHVEATGDGYDLIEGNESKGASISYSFSNVSNSNLSLHSSQASQSIQIVERPEESYSDIQRQIDQILSEIEELSLSIDGMKFESYLRAAVSAFNEIPPDYPYAVRSVSKAVSLEEVVDKLESLEEGTESGIRAWNSCKNLVVLLREQFGDFSQ